MPRDYPKSLCPHLGNQSVFNPGLHLTVWRKGDGYQFFIIEVYKGGYV